MKNREALPYYLTLPELALVAREDLVRNTLAEYRKVLEERVSCNQMEFLMEKREVLLLYGVLNLTCDCRRIAPCTLPWPAKNYADTETTRI